VIGALAVAYREAGWRVIGATPTARAARQLRDIAGVEARTMRAGDRAVARSHGAEGPLAFACLRRVGVVAREPADCRMADDTCTSSMMPMSTSATPIHGPGSTAPMVCGP